MDTTKVICAVLLCMVLVGCGDTILATSTGIIEPSTIYIHYVYDYCHDSLTFNQEFKYIVDCDRSFGKIMIYAERERGYVPSTEGCVHTWRVVLVTPDVEFTIRQIQKWYNTHHIKMIVNKECDL